MELIYNNKTMGSIVDDKIIFNDYDLNPFIDENVFDMIEEEDEYGNIIYVEEPASLTKKIVFLKELGFEFK